MNFYQTLVDLYGRFLSVFPPQIQWVITLLIIVGLVGAFVALIRRDFLFVILLIILLPVILPVVQHFFTDLYHFFLFLVQQLGIQAPKTG